MAVPEAEKGSYNIDLQRAVKHLKATGVIKHDKDIAEKLSQTPGNISSYLNGRAKMPPSFKSSFEKVFALDLADFGEEDEQTSKRNMLVEEAIKRERDAADRERATLERERKALLDDKAFLQELLRTNLELVLVNLKTIKFRQDANGEVALAALDRLIGNPERTLIGVADMRMTQIAEEQKKHDSAAAADR